MSDQLAAMEAVAAKIFAGDKGLFIMPLHTG
jgi:hypothetical protein